MESVECRFPIPRTIQVRETRHLNRENGTQLQRSLFDWVDESSFNEYEKAVALYLDERPEILWWYRNLVGKEHFAIQGYKQQRIYPDFVAASDGDSYPAVVYVVESKGGHLRGNEDTQYKEDIADYFGRLGKAVSWKELGKEFKNRVFRFQVLDQGKYDHNWKERLHELIMQRQTGTTTV